MIISTIKQLGLRLRADPEEIPFQYSANVQMKFEKDENYNDYTVVGYYIPPGESEAKLLSINDDGTFTLGPDCFKQRGTLSFSFNLINSQEEVHLGSIDFEIRYAFGDSDTILPEPEEVWISLVTQVAKDAIKEDVELVKQKAKEASQSALTASEKANEAQEYANNANQSANSANLSASSALTAKNDAIAASNSAIQAKQDAEQSANNAKNSADEALENANASNKAIETVNQIKTQIEDKANEFDINYQEKLSLFNDNATEKQNAFNQSVTSANDLFDKKVVDANNDLDSKLQQANTTIDEKVTEATNQATKAKEEADRATLATDDKLDKNQGTDNVGKVMIVGEDGELTPTEYKSGSDNKLIGTVAKSENPNITDGYQTEMMNLKLYGQSTQGADPSPTNPQEVTAISKFEGAPTGGNIVDWNIEQWNETVKQALNPIVTNDGLIINCNNLTTALTPTIFGQYNVNTLKLDTSKKYIASCNLTNLNITIVVRTSSGQFSLTSRNKQNVLPTGDEYIQQIFINFPQGLTFNGVISFQISVGDNVPLYTPYQSQPFTYTPTNPMYSTQDGSIADYVDVEKGVDVYNMVSEIPNISGQINRYSLGTYDEYEILNALTKNYFAQDIHRGKNCFCNKFVFSNISPVAINSFALGNNNLYIRTESNRFNDVDEFREWLNSINTEDNPLIVVYATTTPTEMPIPQEQLAILRALYTYNCVTNFLCNAPVSFNYEQSLQIVIQNIWNAIGQTNANILLNGGNQ